MIKRIMVFPLIALLAGPVLSLQTAYATTAQLPETQQDAPVLSANAPATTMPDVTTTDEVKNPCPLPKDNDSANTADLARIQEDIDRYTLCVQRAELLYQLNETEVKSRENIDDALGMQTPTYDDLAKEMMGANAESAGLPPPPTGFEAGAIPAMGAGNLGGGTGGASVSSGEWQVNSVSGQGNNLKAVLITPEGSLLKVRGGDILPNDAGTVLSISASDVQIRKDKKVTSLSWAEVDPTIEKAER